MPNRSKIGHQNQCETYASAVKIFIPQGVVAWMPGISPYGVAM